ncbi:MaoC family dehydratase [Qaidamihabitans albus]|uniref:MaoC family dehydratase n=1 Tax=Qaidamihabitans albus TaxID=2795733 RepID=UPI0018F173B5|nr:MaoC family dehydratase [Qaidamihabitans albus]
MQFRTKDFPLWPKASFFEEFEPGQTFDHHWGRTLTESDAVAFNSLTLGYNPLYVNDEYAREIGHPRSPVNPYLAFLTVLGLSVEDTSEKNGGAFLSVEYVSFLEPVYPGDTITAHTTVHQVRESKSRPMNGIVTWHTHGRNQHGTRVLEFSRTNLVQRRSEAR